MLAAFHDTDGFPSTAPAPVPHDHGRLPTAGPPALPPVLAALRVRPWWRLRFPPSLERAYALAAMQARIKRVDICNFIGLAFFWPATMADAQSDPPNASLITALRCAITVLLFTLWGLGIWRGKRRLHWEPDAWIVVSLTVIIGYKLVLGRLSETPMSAVTQGGLFLVIMFSTIVVLQPFRQALGVALFTLVSYALANADATGLVRVIAEGNLRLLFTTAAFSLVANYVLELRARRAYVLRLCEVERQAALTRGVQTLQRLSHRDALTGLSNRRHFDRMLEQAWTGPGQTGWVGLLLIDIDHFKRYNDHYGHPAGDTCLQAVAAALEDTARRHGGMAARLGGEEFAVLLPGQSGAEAALAAEAACAAVRRLGLVHADADAAPVVTVSIGVAAARPADGHGFTHLQGVADQALYRAKNTGRNRCVSSDCPAPSDTAGPPAWSDMPSSVPVQPEPDPDPDEGIEQARWMEGLQAALQRKSWALRFAPELEADYEQTWSHRRGLRLCALGVGGLVYLLAYNWLSRAMFAPQFADIVYSMVQTIAVTVELPLLLLLLLPMGTLLRESILGLAIVSMGISFPLIASTQPTLAAQSFALSLFLVAMFSAVIAEQPFRFVVLPSLAVFATSTWLMRPAETGDLWDAWAECTCFNVVATTYSLITGYLLEHSTRRNHLLVRLDEAQNAALQRQATRLRHLAMVDPVTGIANRRLYEDEQARQWADCAASGRPLALLLLDVDHFKRYNDVYGHPAGDACLRRVAQALVHWSGERAAAGAAMPMPARVGGEEFGVLLPGRTAQEALADGASLCAAIAGLGIAHAGSTTSACLTVSIGVAALSPSAAEAHAASTALLSAADDALYRAKAAGRNRACV